MPKKSIEDLRRKIDRIDDQLLGLLNERGKIASEIGRVKADRGDQVFAVDRENEILSRLADKNAGPLSNEALDDIFQTIFTNCRALQKRLTIAFFGPEATFTHQAAINQFGRNVEFVPVPSIKDVFFEVERGTATFGVVPIENSTEGVVNHTLDMFVQSKLHIVAERMESISHALLSVSGKIKSVKKVYSFPHALAQCRKWLDVHLPGVTVHEAASTADAAVHATLDSSSAAIASQLAAQIYHLKPIALQIEDSPDNATRFLVIGRDLPPPTGKDKTSILFSVKDKVGALYDVLEPFRSAGINLTKIESRPTKKRAWEYLFFVDFIGHQSEKRIQSALKELGERCNFLKILGSYPYGG
ncbi:MAG: prephenate dehydratase [Elusimicrobia bacterium]|nr:prephenate dehydratase [Elusimicrobiota bacterium]